MNDETDSGPAAAVVAVVPPVVAGEAVVAGAAVVELEELELPHADAANAVAMTTDAIARPFLADKMKPPCEDRTYKRP